MIETIGYKSQQSARLKELCNLHPLYLHFSFDDPITGEQFFFKVRASGQAISCALSYRSFPHRHSHTIVSNIILTTLKKIMDRLTGDCDTFCSSLRYFLKNKLKRRLFGALKHFDGPVLLQLCKRKVGQSNGSNATKNIKYLCGRVKSFRNSGETVDR